MQPNDKLWQALDQLKDHGLDPMASIATIVKKEKFQFSAHDLVLLGQGLVARFGYRGPVTFLPDWLERVFIALVEGNLPKVICDPWAGIGILIEVLREATQSEDCIAITANHSEFLLGKGLTPKVTWQNGDPVELISQMTKELDLVASILP